MNEPSPKAKQAAEIADKWFHPGQPSNSILRSEIAQAIDIATAKLREELEPAWGIIANAHGGDWQKATREWQVAAAQWRDRTRSK